MYKIPANTLFIGKQLIYVPECQSTNDLASQLGMQPSTLEGAVVVTDHQTSGKGQRGNVWIAESGKNLTFTIILKPHFLIAHQQFQLNIAIALGISDFLMDTIDSQVSIKWPNDILIDGKKVCGVLIENQLRGETISHSIVGIGLNVNQVDFQFENATSLGILINKIFALPTLLEDLLHKMEIRYLQLRSGHRDLMINEYLNRLYWRDEKHVFSSEQVEFSGTIRGIDNTGRLIIETQTGNRFFSMKEVTYVR